MAIASFTVSLATVLVASTVGAAGRRQAAHATRAAQRVGDARQQALSAREEWAAAVAVAGQAGEGAEREARAAFDRGESARIGNGEAAAPAYLEAASAYRALADRLGIRSLDLGGGVRMVLVRIEAGGFRMGSDQGDSDEMPVHDVRITKGFWLARTEVTQAQWEAVMGYNASQSEFYGGDLPVERVSWRDCQEFLRTLNARVGGALFRLPTEAEWEYACRAGGAADYCFGEAAGQLGDYAWYQGNAGGRTHPVGQRKPNSWGLFDMHGNVWEWCEDTWHDSYEGAPTDGSAWVEADSALRVVRGGSWYGDARRCRSACRLGGAPSGRSGYLGFRVARAP